MPLSNDPIATPVSSNASVRAQIIQKALFPFSPPSIFVNEMSLQLAGGKHADSVVSVAGCHPDDALLAADVPRSLRRKRDHDMLFA
jgi:hypothetical protein